jgi:hypothetical protein
MQEKYKTMLQFGILEKYNKDIHGSTNDYQFNNLLHYKSISFETKEDKQSIQEFINSIPVYLQPNILLHKIYYFNDYCFGIDETRLIIKIQRLWRKCKKNIIKKYNIQNLYKRQIKV